MTKQDKIKKVIDEFKRGTLKTPDGKIVKNHKQALAIAMSESKDYAEKGDLINHLSINSTAEALDILKGAGTEDLFEKAKHQVGDVHPNGKWTWVQLPNGKFDWRATGGRAHKRHDEAQKQKEGGESKTTEEHAKDTSTETLKKVAASANAPSKLKDAAKKELAERGEGGDDKKEDTKVASPDTTKTNATKQKKLRPVGTGTNGPERKRKQSSTNSTVSEQHINAPSSVKSRKSFESYLKKNYSVVANGDYAMHEGGGRKPDGSSNDAKNVYSYHVKDKNGNVSTVAYDGEKLHIYPGQRKIKLGKYGEISTATASSRQYSNYKKL